MFYRLVPAGLRLHMPHLTAGAGAVLRVTLGIRQAELIAVVNSDAAGVAIFAGTIPAGLQGRTLWLQAAQMGVTSNVAVESVD